MFHVKHLQQTSVLIFWSQSFGSLGKKEQQAEAAFSRLLRDLKKAALEC